MSHIIVYGLASLALLAGFLAVVATVCLVYGSIAFAIVKAAKLAWGG